MCQEVSAAAAAAAAEEQQQLEQAKLWMHFAMAAYRTAMVQSAVDRAYHYMDMEDDTGRGHEDFTTLYCRRFHFQIHHLGNSRHAEVTMMMGFSASAWCLFLLVIILLANLCINFTIKFM